MWARNSLLVVLSLLSLCFTGCRAHPIPEGSGFISPSLADCSPRVSIVENGDILSYFYSGVDGTVYSSNSLSEGSWKRIAGVHSEPCAPVTAVVRQPGWTDVFVTDIHGRIMFASVSSSFNASPGAPSIWKTIYGVKTLPGTEVTATSPSENSVYIFVTGSDSRIYTSHFYPKYATYRAWKRTGKLKVPLGTSITANSSSPKNIDIFVTAPNASVLVNSYSPKCKCFPKWKTIKGVIAQPGSPVTAISPTADHLSLFVVAIDGRIWQAGRNTQNYWSPWKPIGYDFQAILNGERILAITPKEGLGVTVVVRGINGKLKWGKAESSDAGDLKMEIVDAEGKVGPVQLRRNKDGQVVMFGIESGRSGKGWEKKLVKEEKIESATEASSEAEGHKEDL